MKIKLLCSALLCLMITACDLPTTPGDSPATSSSASPDSGTTPADILPQLKEQMRFVQTMVETYGVDWGGVYPANVAELYKEATGSDNPYFKEVVNPVSAAKWNTSNASGKGVVEDTPETCTAGMVFYTSNAKKDGYTIGGCDAGGKTISFELSNS